LNHGNHGKTWDFEQQTHGGSDQEPGRRLGGFGLNLVTSTKAKWEFDPPEKWWDQLRNDQKTCFTLPGCFIFRTPLLCFWWFQPMRQTKLQQLRPVPEEAEDAPQDRRVWVERWAISGNGRRIIGKYWGNLGKYWDIWGIFGKTWETLGDLWTY